MYITQSIVLAIGGAPLNTPLPSPSLLGVYTLVRNSSCRHRRFPSNTHLEDHAHPTNLLLLPVSNPSEFTRGFVNPYASGSSSVKRLVCVFGCSCEASGVFAELQFSAGV